MLRGRKLQDDIGRELLLLIAKAASRPGDRLPPERLLAERLQVSRGVLRQALAALVAAGVIESRHGSGTYTVDLFAAGLPDSLRPPGFDRAVPLDDILAARLAIELPALRAACRQSGRDAHPRLAACIDGMRAAVGDGTWAFIEADMAFHRALVEAGGNTLLVTAFDAIGPHHLRSQVETHRGRDDELAAIGQHQAVLDALRAGNAVRAEAELTRHLAAMGG